MHANLVSVYTERALVSPKFRGSEAARGALFERAVRHERLRVRMRQVEYGCSGVHRDVAVEHAVEHARLLKGADQGQTSLVVGEADAIDEDGHVARWRVLGVGDTEQQRRLVQVHDALHRIVVHLVAEDAVDDGDVAQGRAVGDRHVDASVH